eukprot:Gb_35540 [translate_table: standard]
MEAPQFLLQSSPYPAQLNCGWQTNKSIRLRNLTDDAPSPSPTKRFRSSSSTPYATPEISELEYHEINSDFDNIMAFPMQDYSSVSPLNSCKQMDSLGHIHEFDRLMESMLYDENQSLSSFMGMAINLGKAGLNPYEFQMGMSENPASSRSSDLTHNFYHAEQCDYLGSEWEQDPKLDNDVITSKEDIQGLKVDSVCGDGYTQDSCHGTTANDDNEMPTKTECNGSSADEIGHCDEVRLIHLLIACAEAVAAHNRELASVILARLRESMSGTATTMQRLATYFCHGLECRMEGNKGKAFPSSISNPKSQSDILSAFQVLQEISPYIKFGHFTANQAILEAIQGERKVHIVDYDIMEGIQWPSLMQGLISMKESGRIPHLRITALSRPHAKGGFTTVQETGKRLSSFAASLGLPFSFHQARLEHNEELRNSALKLHRDEVLVINCMLHLPHMAHRDSKYVLSFLRGVNSLCPRILTLVEEELSSTANTFPAHFMEALHQYSAIFDSLEASFSSHSVARSLVERIFLGPRIASTVTAARAKGISSTIVRSAGFESVPISLWNHCQAKLLLGLFSDGYRLEEKNGRLLLGWRNRPLISASIWTPKAGFPL